MAYGWAFGLTLGASDIGEADAEVTVLIVKYDEQNVVVVTLTIR